MDNFLKWVRYYVSPLFALLLVASLILWHIVKLNYTYTTTQVVHVNVDGQKLPVTSVIEGMGTNLFGYRVYMNKTLRIPLSRPDGKIIKSSGQ